MFESNQTFEEVSTSDVKNANRFGLQPYRAARAAKKIRKSTLLVGLSERRILSKAMFSRPTAVWTRIEMCRDFFVRASSTFFDQIILPIRNQMVEKV